jgi:hypothetical protein
MDSLRAKVDAATSRFREQYKAVGEKAAQAVKQPKSGNSKYHSLTTQAEEDGVFTIDEAEDVPMDSSLCVHPHTPGSAAGTARDPRERDQGR